jgi:hypothetical protein
MVDEIDDEEFEPLECLPVPVAIEAHDVEVGGRATIRLFFTPCPGADPRRKRWARLAGSPLSPREVRTRPRAQPDALVAACRGPAGELAFRLDGGSAGAGSLGIDPTVEPSRDSPPARARPQLRTTTTHLCTCRCRLRLAAARRLTRALPPRSPAAAQSVSATAVAMPSSVAEAPSIVIAVRRRERAWRCRSATKTAAAAVPRRTPPAASDRH